MKTISEYRFEDRLIVCLLRSETGDEPRSLIQRPGIDWQYILDTCERHRIVPLVCKKLKGEYSELVPQTVLNLFQKRFNSITAQNFARATQMIKLAGELESCGIPVAAYKGSTLAAMAYRDPALRQFTDIDLFIRKKDFPQAKALAEKLGCRPAWDLTARQEKAVLKHYYEFPFFYGENNTLIEIHWKFLETFFAFEIDPEEIFARASTVKLYGRDVRTLSAEDYLAVLCAHGSKHFWNRLGWICDVARLLENTEIDLAKAEAIAKKSGGLRMMLLGMYLAREISGTKLPGNIDAQMRKDPAVASLGEKFISGLFENERDSADWIKAAELHLAMREKATTKLKYSYRLFAVKLIDKLFMPMGRPQ